MDLDELGLYTLLLCRSWIEGSIPADLGELARMLKLPVPRLKKLWPAVSPCFEVRADGRLVQPRLEYERDKQAEYRGRMSTAGKAGAAKRWPSDGKAIALPGIAEGQHAGARFSSSSSLSETTATPPSPERAVESDGLRFGRWFFATGVDAGAVPAHLTVDPGPLGFAYKHHDASASLVAAHGDDECRRRAANLFARKTRTDADKLLLEATPSTLRDRWDWFDQAERERPGKRGREAYDQTDLSGGTNYVEIVTARSERIEC